MPEADHPPYGKSWAAKDETRPSRFRTPLAHAPGHEGGVLFVRDGASSERWVTMTAWREWVAENRAALVADDQPDVPWEMRDE